MHLYLCTWIAKTIKFRITKSLVLNWESYVSWKENVLLCPIKFIVYSFGLVYFLNIPDRKNKIDSVYIRLTLITCRIFTCDDQNIPVRTHYLYLSTSTTCVNFCPRHKMYCKRDCNQDNRSLTLTHFPTIFSLIFL